MLRPSMVDITLIRSPHSRRHPHRRMCERATRHQLTISNSVFPSPQFSFTNNLFFEMSDICPAFYTVSHLRLDMRTTKITGKH